MVEAGGSTPSVREVFESYERYVSSLDDLCQRLRQTYWNAIYCRPGCVDCCSQELTLFPLEAAWMRRRMESFTGNRKSRVRAHLEEYRTSGQAQPCPFLSRGRCLLYAARPLLCRTEGYALAYRSPAEGRWEVTACSKNFKELDPRTEIPERDIINLESLNQSLVVLNHAYVKAAEWKGPERVRLSEILVAPLALD